MDALKALVSFLFGHIASFFAIFIGAGICISQGITRPTLDIIVGVAYASTMFGVWAITYKLIKLE